MVAVEGTQECVERHSVFIYDRGGRSRLFQLTDIASVSWERLRDDISTASVVISGDACDRQASTLRQIEPKRMEMVIYRGKDRVYEGPIMRVAWHSEQVEIFAQDVTTYLHARPLTQTWDNSYAAIGLPDGTVERLDRTSTTTGRLDRIIRHELSSEFIRQSSYATETVYRPFTNGGSLPYDVRNRYRIALELEAVDPNPAGTSFTWEYRFLIHNLDSSRDLEITTPPTALLSIGGNQISIPSGPWLDFSEGEFQHVLAEGSFVGPALIEYAAIVEDPTEQLGRAEISGEIQAEGETEPIPGWEQIDPPANVLPYLQVHERDADVRTSAKTEPFQMSVGEHLDNYAQNGGIDYVTVGRAIHIWDTHDSIGRLRTLTEADFFGEVIVTAYGADHAELGFVVAEITEYDSSNLDSGEETEIKYGSAGSNSDYYGPWAKIFTVYNEDNTAVPTQQELNGQAQRNIAGRSPVPVEVRVPDNSSIRISDSLGINDLVPGVLAPLRATLNSRQITQLQKLDSVSVSETPEGENVSVSFSPATRSQQADWGEI